jgi:hypothetical protein
MQASPWFSMDKEESRPEAAVHHNNLRCTRGKRVGRNHHRYGTDNRALCPHCIRLNAAGR